MTDFTLSEKLEMVLDARCEVRRMGFEARNAYKAGYLISLMATLINSEANRDTVQFHIDTIAKQTEEEATTIGVTV